MANFTGDDDAPDPSTDKPSIGLNMIASGLPFIGLLMSFQMKDTKPKQARSIGIWSLVGLGIYLLFGGSILEMARDD